LLWGLVFAVALQKNEVENENKIPPSYFQKEGLSLLCKCVSMLVSPTVLDQDCLELLFTLVGVALYMSRAQARESP